MMNFKILTCEKIWKKSNEFTTVFKVRKQPDVVFHPINRLTRYGHRTLQTKYHYNRHIENNKGFST